MNWLSKVWKWAVPGLLAGFGALWAIFKRKPKLRPKRKMDEKERKQRHDEVRRKHAEKAKKIRKDIRTEVDDCLDRWRNS